MDNNWQDIASAPKDGTVIDLWTYNGERWTDAFWHNGLGIWAMRWAGLKGAHGWIIPNGQPTHWMPLPAPPKPDPQ